MAAGANDTVRSLLFEHAALGVIAADRPKIEDLKRRGSFAISYVVLDAYDETVHKVTCAGWLSLELPEDASARIDGQKKLEAGVTFTIQPGADGKGDVFNLSGANELLPAIVSASGARRLD